MHSGMFVTQPGGYKAFIPEPLRSDPALDLDADVIALLSEADQALGRLDGSIYTLPNPDFFVGVYVRQEAVFSSQIEGSKSCLTDLLRYEATPKSPALPEDITEVHNYVSALDYGLGQLERSPISLDLIRGLHAKLLDGTDAQLTPGRFRECQNWIGIDGSDLHTAQFVPPPVVEMRRALRNLEVFLNAPTKLPVLIQCALAHAQFESIHPFIDGNGRIGRLLIVLMLCGRHVLRRPLLYPSHYLKRHRVDYYDRLTATRERHDWLGWIKFFLQGVLEASGEATQTALAILDMRETHRKVLAREFEKTGRCFDLLEHIFEHPVTTVRRAQSALGSSYRTANELVAAFVGLGLLVETTGQRRNRVYRYAPYLALFPES